MKRNEELQKDVQDAIKWEPLLSEAEIGVVAKDGVITLTGTVDRYSRKSEAEDAAKRVAGVKAVVEHIEVKFTDNWAKNDEDIAREIIHAFKWNWKIPDDKIRVKIENGWVTLEGELQWNYQKEEAIKSVKNIFGIAGFTDLVLIRSETNNAIEKKNIENAIFRNWTLDGQDIRVSVSSNKVILTGTVDSWYQKDEAGRVSWNSPGVWSVENDLVVEYDYAIED